MYEVPGWKMELHRRLEEIRRRRRSQKSAKEAGKKSEKRRATAPAA